ncbi:MAG: protein kinase [Planctomycetes bacterium]|nr:protein kinase [Planctomycetota bacterium]
MSETQQIIVCPNCWAEFSAQTKPAVDVKCNLCGHQIKASEVVVREESLIEDLPSRAVERPSLGAESSAGQKKQVNSKKTGQTSGRTKSLKLGGANKGGAKIGSATSGRLGKKQTTGSSTSGRLGKKQTAAGPSSGRLVNKNNSPSGSSGRLKKNPLGGVSKRLAKQKDSQSSTETQAANSPEQAKKAKPTLPSKRLKATPQAHSIKSASQTKKSPSSVSKRVNSQASEGGRDESSQAKSNISETKSTPPNELHEAHSNNESSQPVTNVNDPSAAMSIGGLDTWILRLNQEGIIKYVNTPFCQNFNIKKSDVINHNLEILKKIMAPGLFKLIRKPGPKGVTSAVAKDKQGRDFEVKVTASENGMDVVFQDVTTELKFKTYVQQYISMDLTKMSDEDLSTFKYPERRFMSVSFTDLRDFTAMSEKLKPEEVRTTMNAYLEDIIHAIHSNNGTVDKIVGDAVMALYGAPKYYKDHALRSIKTACDQMLNLKALQKSFARFGKIMPDCGIGINSGEMVVGNMGCLARQDYTVIGSSVNIAARICGAARGGEIVLTETTLKTVLEDLPQGWESIESRSSEDTMGDFKGNKVQGLYPLSSKYKNKIIEIGPSLSSQPEKWMFRFAYLYAVKVKGVDRPLSVISVVTQKINEKLSLKEEVADNSCERIFGKYRLLELLGKGGMGEVWKAKDNFGNTLAIKIMLSGNDANAKQIKRFKREAGIMAKLQHRNICRIHEVGEYDHTSYIAMEYIEGVSLSEVLNPSFSSSAQSAKRTKVGKNRSFAELVNDIYASKSMKVNAVSDENSSVSGAKKKKKYRVLPLDQTMQLVIRCCESVQFAHEKGVLHRDLKPANIMLRKNGEPVLMDFGLAKMEGEVQEAVSVSISGQILGTIEYMSPEQARSSVEVNELSDIFSMGAILYQMLTGQRHFYTTGNILVDANTLQKHVPIRPRQLNHNVSKDLELIVLKALRCSPRDRYQSIPDLVSDLQLFSVGHYVSATEVSHMQIMTNIVKNNKIAAFCVIISLISLLGGLVYFVGKTQSSWEQEMILTEITQARDDALALADETLSRVVKANEELDVKDLKISEYEMSKTELEQEVEKQKAEYEKLSMELNAEKESNEKALETVSLNRQADRALLERDLELLSSLSLKVLELDPTNLDACLRLSALYVAKKDFLMADNYLSQITAEDNPIKKDLQALCQDSTQSEDKDIDERIMSVYLKHDMYQLVQAEKLDKEKTVMLWRKKIEASLPSYGNALTVDDLGFWRLNLNEVTGVDDLSFLKGIQLHSLSLVDSHISSLEGVQGMGLKELDISGSFVSELEPLIREKLEVFSCARTNVKQLWPLNNHPLLEVDISETRIRKLTVLANAPLHTLIYRNIEEFNGKFQLADFSSIKNLDLAHNHAMKSLECFSQSPLEKVFIQGTNITDITPLTEKAIQSLCFNPERIETGLLYIKLSESITAVGDIPEGLMPPTKFWPKYEKRLEAQSEKEALPD